MKLCFHDAIADGDNNSEQDTTNIVCKNPRRQRQNCEIAQRYFLGMVREVHQAKITYQL